MKKIKYKLYNSNTNEIIKVRKLEFLGSRIRINEDIKLVINTEKQSHIRLLEYTGFKDSNDKKIYEGDLVLFEEFSYDTYKIVCDEKRVWKAINIHVEEILDLYDIISDSKCYITGNIYNLNKC